MSDNDSYLGHMQAIVRFVSEIETETDKKHKDSVVVVFLFLYCLIFIISFCSCLRIHISWIKYLNPPVKKNWFVSGTCAITDLP